MQKISTLFLPMALMCALCLSGDFALASDAGVKAKLDTVAAALVRDAAQNLLPKPNNKTVSQENGYYVARYAAINTQNVVTELMKGQGGDYVGMIKYEEQHFACRGASKAEALKAPCSRERTRKMTEIVAYTKGKWLYH